MIIVFGKSSVSDPVAIAAELPLNSPGSLANPHASRTAEVAPEFLSRTPGLGDAKLSA